MFSLFRTQPRVDSETQRVPAEAASDTLACARRVSRRFRQALAVDGVDFVVRRGEVVALMGPNGSGKSTLLRMLLGFLIPTGGTVELFGAPPNLAGRRRVGFLPEQRGLFFDMGAAHQLAWWGRMHGMSRREADDEAERWLARLGLADRKSAELRTFSKGMQQRMEVAAALIHGPELAILDEPFSGLDPISRDVITQIIEEERSRGTGIVVCTHDLAPLEAACDHVTVLSRGRKILDERSNDLRARAGAGQRLHDAVVQAMREAGVTAWEETAGPAESAMGGAA